MFVSPPFISCRALAIVALDTLRVLRGSYYTLISLIVKPVLRKLCTISRIVIYANCHY
nr:MAG TPA: hypothetical protein [Caudoviricetes sp.]